MPGPLSPRETQVLDLVAAGLTSKAIAARLAISESTVNWHLSNVLRKLDASSRAEAVAIAMRDGQLGAGNALRSGPRPGDTRRWQLLLAALTTVVLATLGISAAVLSMSRPPAAPASPPTPAAATSPAIRSEQPVATPTLHPSPSATATSSVPNMVPPLPLTPPPATSLGPTAVPLAIPTLATPSGRALSTALPTPLQTLLPTPLPTPALPTLQTPELGDTLPPLPSVP